MNVFFIENGIDGLLSSIYFSFEKKILPDKVTDGNGYQQELTDSEFYIKTDMEKANKIADSLTRYGGYDVIRRIKSCMLSCEPNAFLYAFRFAYKTLYYKKDLSGALSDKTVSDFAFTEQKVWTEAHRIKGFLRFAESHGGVIYARYSPDNDVTELIAPHFLKRLSGLSFVIHDIKRNKVAVSDGFNVLLDKTELPASFVPSERETAFADLFKTYYREINIEERKNTKQQNSYMPKRYRKYMPETYET